MPVVPKTLTDKQRRFVEEYCLDLCATQAAIRAGYSRRSAKEQGHENLTQPHIKAAIADWQARKASRVETTWQEIHDELRKLAFARRCPDSC
jgi:phage terminase small subunit